ncbi:FecR domain-containing protein [Bradyrhizobium sp. Leo121]|uniref:FecR domain-containing protein n=1 Tax=Bradyrhizobium sp. Leo121 TaxID=1571195 RepID=UPI00102A0B1F|nr:FecR domain-containing protein [Bradyrhizobium sp. Leo121]RZN31363.1 iron dicitrate transport regulator FecR [Bradyrhizobium sp. Leo121]
MTPHRFSLALLFAIGLLLGGTVHTPAAAADSTQLTQTQPVPAPAQAPATQAPDAPAADAQQPTAEPIGNVADLTGSASVIRNNATTALQIRDDIFAGDVVETRAKSTLGITFNDATTFKLSASARITIDRYVYDEGGKQNAGMFDVAKGTVAFVAAGVAKTGDMRISTPTATLGIRGTTGLVEVPEGATATSNNVAIKLYPDADGRVGRIEINDRGGAQLGTLTRGASGFTIRPDRVGGARFAAVPLTMSALQIQRDRGFVRQLYTTQNFGRQLVNEQRAFRRANPGVPYPNRGQPFRPGPQRQNMLPGQQNRPGQQPGQQNRPGQRQPGAPDRQGLQQRPGGPQQAGPSRTDQHRLPGQPGGTPLPRTGQQGAPRQGAEPSRAPQRVGQPPSIREGQPQRGGFRQGAPGVQRPGLLNRPTVQPRRQFPLRDGRRERRGD